MALVLLGEGASLAGSYDKRLRAERETLFNLEVFNWKWAGGWVVLTGKKAQLKIEGGGRRG